MTIHPTPPYPVPVPAIPAALPIVAAIGVGSMISKAWNSLWD